MNEPIGEKAKHVRQAQQTRWHKCHWPGCDVQCKPAQFSCTHHWYMLPRALRTKIWGAYRIGQEEDMNPSRQYLEVVAEVQQWIKEHGG
jgi:hypothetical protein